MRDMGRRAEVLVVGASGLVGRLLMDRFGERASGTAWHNPREGLLELDITDADATLRLVATAAPRVVLHTAALTDVNRCEVEPEASRLVNVQGTRHMAAAAQAAGARYVFFSTDYVFGDGGPHDLDAVRAPLNVYGRHKAEAEDIVRVTVDDHAIVRACNVYGWQPGGRNYVMMLREALLARAGHSPASNARVRAAHGAEAVPRVRAAHREDAAPRVRAAHGAEAVPRVRAAMDQMVSPTLAADLADAVERLALSSLRGVFHLAGPDNVTRLDWALRAARAFGLDESLIEPVPFAALGAAAPRPLRGGLVAHASEQALGMRFRGLDEGLAAMRRDIEAASV